MKKILACFLIIGSVLTSPLLAQQDAQLSNYMFNQLTFNPAFAGVEGFTKMSFVHRTQWINQGITPPAGIQSIKNGNPETQFMTLNAPLLKFRSGVGVSLLNDNLGALNNVQAQVSYAYHLAVSDKSKLSFGMGLGIFAQTVDANLWRPIDGGDPVLPSGRQSQVRPDLSIGVHYQTEKYYLGLSASHLLKQEFDFGTSARNPLEQHVYFTAGYNYEVNYNFILTPTVLIKSDLNEYSFDIGAIGTYDEKFWGGAQFRQGEAAILMAGAHVLKDKSMSVGVAFDVTVKGVDAKSPGSYEVMLSYRLPHGSGPGKKAVRTPRFRHTNSSDNK